MIVINTTNIIRTVIGVSSFSLLCLHVDNFLFSSATASLCVKG